MAMSVKRGKGTERAGRTDHGLPQTSGTGVCGTNAGQWSGEGRVSKGTTTRLTARELKVGLKTHLSGDGRQDFTSLGAVTTGRIRMLYSGERK